MTSSQSPLMAPFDLWGWIDEYKEDFKPPVCARMLVKESADYVMFIVGGPNRRTDYHVNMTEEFFYQLKGDMTLKVVDRDGSFRDVNIREGQVFLLPGNIPHSPQRNPETIGLVIECRRREGHVDALQWYCERSECHHLLYREEFSLVEYDIGKALTPIMNKYAESDELRTCGKCGHVSAPAAAKGSGADEDA